MDVTDRIVVLDFGRKIAEGTPAEVRQDPAVIAGLPGGRPPMLLELQDVEVFYGRIQAIKGLSFTVDDGEIVTLIGANGAGKTTTLKAISGIRPIAGGQVLFDGADITVDAAAQAGRARHLPGARGPRHLPRHDASGRTSRWAATPARTRRRRQAARPRAGVHAVPPAGRAAHPDGRHAVRRRAADAGHRAGAHGPPRLLLLDEPSMGLAPMLIAQIFTIITEINEQGTTILLVEQNAAQALRPRRPRLRAGDGSHREGGRRARDARRRGGAGGVPGRRRGHRHEARGVVGLATLS